MPVYCFAVRMEDRGVRLYRARAYTLDDAVKFFSEMILCFKEDWVWSYGRLLLELC